MLLVNASTVWTQKDAVIDADIDILQLLELFWSELSQASLHEPPTAIYAVKVVTIRISQQL